MNKITLNSVTYSIAIFYFRFFTKILMRTEHTFFLIIQDFQKNVIGPPTTDSHVWEKHRKISFKLNVIEHYISSSIGEKVKMDIMNKYNFKFSRCVFLNEQKKYLVLYWQYLVKFSRHILHITLPQVLRSTLSF